MGRIAKVRRRIISITTTNVDARAFGGLVPRVRDPMDGGRIPADSVLARPGWTPALLARYLGRPDERINMGDEWLPLYSMARVLEAEAMWNTDKPTPA